MTRPARGIAVAVLVATFVVGALAGVALEEVVEDLDWPGQLGGGDDDDLDEEDELLQGLELSADQRREIERILEAREDRIEAYWRARLPDVQAILESSRAQIREVLTPPQREQFDRRLARLETRGAGEDRD